MPDPKDVPDGWTIVEGHGVDAPAIAAAAKAPSAGTWEHRGLAGDVWHPASGVQERNRADVTLGGMPPELAAVSGLGVARAVGGAGLSLAGRAVAGAKAIASQAGPVVKYEALKHGLSALGLPATVSIPLAMAVSGYKHPTATAKLGAADVVKTATADSTRAAETAAATRASAAVPPTVPAMVEQPSTAAQREAMKLPPSAPTPTQHGFQPPTAENVGTQDLQPVGPDTPQTAATRAEISAGLPKLNQKMAALRKTTAAAGVKLTAKQTQKALQFMQQFEASPLGGLPSDEAMAADLSQRGPLGGRTPNPAVTKGPTIKGKSPQQVLNEEAIARYRARETAAAASNPFR